MGTAGVGRRTVPAAAVLAVLVAGGVRTASAQTRSFAHYTGREGLPQAQVLALYQDRESYIWIGTYGGLTRFDGRRFTTFTRRDGLTSNSVRAIGEDGKGRLIVGTVGGGVCVRESPGFRCFGTADGLPDPDVAAVLSEPTGGFWAATEAGVARVGADDSVTVYGESEGLPGPAVSRIERDRSGRLWVATNRGLAWLEGNRFVPDTVDGLRDTPITLLLALHDGLLVGTSDRVFVRRSQALDPLPFREVVRPVGAALTSTSEIWIATAGGVLHQANSNTERLTREHGLLDDITNTVLVDREGNVWLGSESGLSRHTPGPFSQFTVREGLPNPFARALSADREGRLWVGTRDGLAVREGARFRQAPMPGVPDRRVYALAALPDGGMLVGTRQGLVHYDGGVRRVFLTRDGLPNDFVPSLLPDGAGGVWVGTAGGLAYWSGGRLHEVDSSLRDAFVTSLMIDRRGRLWMGKRAGGVIVRDGSRLTNLGPPEGLSDQTIWGMAEDATGATWVATNGDGVFRVGPDGDIRAYTQDDGLVNDFVWQVLPDRRGGVWFYTSRGLDRYVNGRFDHYGPDDGLLELEGSASAVWQDADGDIWFGTGNGVVRYQAGLDVPHMLPPPVYVEGMTVGERTIDLADAHVPAGAGTLRITFTSPTFRDSTAMGFRYRLGASDEWSPPTRDRSVTLARLEPGRYRFEVQAITGDAVASTTPAALAFTVLPAFWQTWLFQGVSLLALLGLTASLPWLRSRHLRRDHERLGRLVAESTRALAEHNQRLESEVADRIAAETESRRARDSEQRLEAQLRHAQKMEAVGQLAGGIAHDFNNLLTAIVCHTEFASEAVAPGSPVSTDLAEIKRAAERATSLVSQLLTFSRQQMVKRRPLDLNVVAAEATRMLTRVLGSNIELRLELHPTAAWVLGDQGQLDQILLNLALNARDAMPSGGRLTIGLCAIDDRDDRPPNVPAGRLIVLDVSDTGHGIDPAIKDRLFDPFFTTKPTGQGTGLGLATVYGIVQQNGWQITVDSAPGRGARFRVYLPVTAPPQQADVPTLQAETPARTSTGQVVLVAEDQDSVRKLVCQTLARKGYRVLAAADGTSAVELSRQSTERIDLLLSDMVMPGMNGRQVADQITEQRPGIRVLFMSGHADGVLGRNGLIEEEHTHLIRKPFTPAELAQRVDEVLAAVLPP